MLISTGPLGAPLCWEALVQFCGLVGKVCGGNVQKTARGRAAGKQQGQDA